MEEFKNKVFLVKVPTEVLDYLNNSEESKVGNLEIFLNKKRKLKPEYTIKFNKTSGPSKFSFLFNKTNDYFYFTELDKKQDMKITNIDNFGRLIINDENESNKLIENIFNRETNKSKEIQVKEVKDKEKKYKRGEEIQLTDKKYMDKDKKEKRVRMNENELEKYIRTNIPKNKYLTPKEIADKLDIPENQVKELMNKICEIMTDGKKKFYQLKDDDL